MRSVLSLSCVLGICCASFAQTGQSSWANLNGLKAAQKIQIVEMNGKQDSGSFLTVSDSAITFKDLAGEKSVQKADVRSLKLMKNKHRLRNTLIGLGVGAGAGAGIGAAIGPSNGFIIGKGYSAAIVGVFGAVCGTAVGALWPSHETVYRAPSP
jgi:hypothetical protein